MPIVFCLGHDRIRRSSLTFVFQAREPPRVPEPVAALVPDAADAARDAAAAAAGRRAAPPGRGRRRTGRLHAGARHAQPRQYILRTT